MKTGFTCLLQSDTVRFFEYAIRVVVVAITNLVSSTGTIVPTNKKLC